MRDPLAPLPVEELSYRCDPERFPFTDTSELKPLEGIIGQGRALRALQLGLELNAPGYNVFLSGLVGNGRTTALKAHLENAMPYCPLANDRAYVFNFRDPRCPELLTFPRGRASQFARDMDGVLIAMIRELPTLLSNDDAQDYVTELRRSVEGQKEAEIKTLSETLEEDGFTLVQVQEEDGSAHLAVCAVIEGVKNPVTEEMLGRLIVDEVITEDQSVALTGKFHEHRKELRKLMRGWRLLEVEFMRDLDSARSAFCAPFINQLLGSVRKEYPFGGIDEYLTGVEIDVIDNLALFTEFAQESTSTPSSVTPEVAQAFYRYRVNVILDNRNREGCPVVIDHQPSFTHLFGGVERPADRESEPLADFMHLQSGSLLEADGGFLILDAADLLREPGCWPRLKATLRYGMLEIPEVDGDNRRVTTLKPMAIPIRVKVLLLGSFELYQQLVLQDREFQHVFKVRVDFEPDIPLSETLVTEQVPRLIRKLCEEESLIPVHKSAVARLVERTVRWSENRERMSTVFTQLADLVRESNYWANSRGSSVVEAEDVEATVQARHERASMPEDRSRRSLEEGTVLIDVKGKKVGQINGLVVRSIGHDSFGMPVRITASVGMGDQEIISVEREVGLSGETHDKGVQILTGYLRSQYAAHFPLSLSASITFEQSYGGVDGDSASSTEMYCILSAISGIPLRQDLAVTGSMNQLGQIQAVGGVNEKVEGFYHVMKALGSDGEPGCIVPSSCVPSLMLSDEVLEAVRAGEFRVYAIDTVDQGLELLTGMPAGQRREDGSYPELTVHAIVRDRLQRYAEEYAGFVR